MAQSIRISAEANSRSDAKLREERRHRLGTIALIVAGTLALLLIFYFTSAPTVQPPRDDLQNAQK